ncbi:hypothetical protein LOTGIDRAFT_175856 [Lottia gigantea]|uniref:Fibronectin type-III domain-containing protein n=1 Tax=Lottia gigantea TaxID=225164 RepID=V4A627_LOTGI|nr:hypothetical protein LOTGIDRAFT_175856 [Lottia gigantea]ESO88741.1 hypothetical protein LOTGIDRAFT_175856 [Lottia gigantea]
MDLKWLKTMIILSVGLCLVFTFIEAQPSITINGSTATPRTFQVNDNMTIKCTIPSNYTSGSNLRVYKGAPQWDEDVQEPVIFSSSPTNDKKIYLKIVGNPQPTYSIQKFTSTGLQDLSLNIDVINETYRIRLLFRKYTEDSHGVFQIVANNPMGTFTTNFTLRGETAPPTNVRAWSNTTRSINVEWTAGEMFETETNYNVYYKTEDTVFRWSTLLDMELTVTHILKSLEPSTTYYIMVRAYHTNSGSSSYSKMTQATTLVGFIYW